MNKRPKHLVCYIRQDIQEWFMTDDSNDEEFLISLLRSDEVPNNSIFVIPIEGLMFGGIWLWNKAHDSQRFQFSRFFEEYMHDQPEVRVLPEVHEMSQEIRQERDFNRSAKYGFISPEGKYFHCEYQEHHSLAYNICFGQYETNNPELYLEEHGWCKIYSPSGKERYGVYVGGSYTLTNAQFLRLQELGLEGAYGVKGMLLKDC